MANEDLTELHYFGIPTAYFDLFPKGQTVAIRTVYATSQFCISYPTVANLGLRRIAQSEFELLLEGEAFVPVNVIEELEVTLVASHAAQFPVTIRQVQLSERTVHADAEFDMVIS